jgi:dienelactone hydrolase
VPDGGFARSRIGHARGVDISRSRTAVACVLVLIVSACGDDGASQETTGPYAVGTRSLTFVDQTRETPAFGDTPAQPTRTVVTDIWYPAAGDPAAATTADAPPAEGRFPVIVFNHGQQGEPQQYALSLETWAKAGYVVAAPRHPLTIRGGPGAQFVDDMAGELSDIPFVLDSLDDELSDVADLDHVAVAGHSSGAIVSYAAGFNTCCHDDRVDAVLVEALLPIPLEGEYAEDLKGTPVMFLLASADTDLLAQDRAEFDSAAPPKFFVTLEGGDHSDTFRVGPQAEVVSQAALAFFDLSVKERDDALGTLQGIPGVEAVPE